MCRYHGCLTIVRVFCQPRGQAVVSRPNVIAVWLRETSQAGGLCSHGGANE